MRSYRWLFWVLAVTGLVLDQASKYAIFSQLYNHGWGGEITVVDGYFNIEAQFDFRLTGTWTSDGPTPISLTFAEDKVTLHDGKETRTGTWKAEWQAPQPRDWIQRIDWEYLGGAVQTFRVSRDQDGTLIFDRMGPGKDLVQFKNVEKKPVRLTQESSQDSGLIGELRTLGGPQLPRVNQGALFGLGQGYNWLFTVVSVAAAVLIIGFAQRTAIRQDVYLCTALGLILAGTLGNFYDRLVFSGVRDFVHWFIRREGKPVFDWPVFNIADCCLVVGAGTLLIHAFLVPQAPAAESSSQTPAVGTVSQTPVAGTASPPPEAQPKVDATCSGI